MHIGDQENVVLDEQESIVGGINKKGEPEEVSEDLKDFLNTSFDIPSDDSFPPKFNQS